MEANDGGISDDCVDVQCTEGYSNEVRGHTSKSSAAHIQSVELDEVTSSAAAATDSADRVYC